MLSCCLCKSSSKDPSFIEETSYRPKARCDYSSPLQLHQIQANETLVHETHFNKDEEIHPLTHTKVTTTNNGNTVNMVKTTTSYAKVVKTESEEEDNVDIGQSDRVYRTTVIKKRKKLRKRFNLKSILNRRMRNAITFDEKDIQFHQQCLFAHNRYRLKHGLKPLVLNQEMCKYATEWANRLAKNNILQHRKNSHYGENLALGTGEVYTPDDAVKSWYEEINNYDFEEHEFRPNTGHFSQIVWHDTTQVGVGVASKDNRTWVVCNYDPPGNILSQFKNNIVAPKVGSLTRPKNRNSCLSDKSCLSDNSRLSDKLRMDAGQDDVGPSTSQGARRTGNNTKFESECLEAHNKYRKLHGCPPMTLNRTLCTFSSDWAKHLCEIKVMEHRQDCEYGENLYMSVNKDPTGEDAVKAWYDEIKSYKFSKPGFNSATGHFTQLVWNDSKELGVGIAKVDKMVFVVCNYNPPGNVLSQFKAQVPPVEGLKGTPKSSGRKSRK